jgi:phosphoesterase RecJ-like protein
VDDRLARVRARLSAAQKVLVVGHVRPDGDAISSSAALALMLRQLGKEARACIPDRIPCYFREIPGVEVIEGVDALRGWHPDTTVVVDSGSLERIGPAAELLPTGKPDIVLDHHATNTGFGVLNLCDPSYPATSLLIYRLAKGWVPLDRHLAHLLLLGLATDTGFFKYASVDARTLHAAGELVALGGDLAGIAAAVLEHRSLAELKLLQKMLGTVTLEAEGKLAWGYVSADMLRSLGLDQQASEGFVGELRNLRGVEVAILFTEWPPGEVHVSLRSKGGVDVAELAARLGGGGHPRAAGCSFRGLPLPQAIARVTQAALAALARESPRSRQG